MKANAVNVRVRGMGRGAGRRKALAGVSVFAAAGLLVACGADEDTTASADNNGNEATVAETDRVESGETQTAETSADGGVSEIAPDTFEVEGGYVLRYETDGTAGECSFSEAGVTCVGTAADDVPEIEVPPFDPAPPAAVTAAQDGVDYYVMEGAPPAEVTLEPGQRVRLHLTTCEALDESTLRCDYDGNGFEITGSDRMIVTDEEPLGRYFVE